MYVKGVDWYVGCWVCVSLSVPLSSFLLYRFESWMFSVIFGVVLTSRPARCVGCVLQAPNGDIKDTRCSSQYCSSGGNIVNNVNGTLSCLGVEDGVAACLVRMIELNSVAGVNIQP